MHPASSLTMFAFYFLVFLFPFSIFILLISPKHWHRMFTICLGVIIGFINIHSSEVQLLIILLLIFGLFLGFTNPKHAWLTALILVIWIPVSQCIYLIATNAQEKFISDGVGSLLSFIPAFVGVYVGVMAKKFGVTTSEK